MTARTAPTCLGIPVGKLPNLVARLQAASIEPETVLRACNLSLARLRSPDARLTLADWLALNQRAACLLRDPDLGLHLGESFAGMPTLLGYLMSACRTAGEALRVFARYQRLEHEGWLLVTEQHGVSTVLEYRFLVAETRHRLLIDYALASIVGQFHRLTGEPLRIEAASFTYPRPKKIAEHLRLFPGDLSFAAEQNALTFPSAALDQPLLRASPEVYVQLQGALERALRALDAREPVSARVLRVLGERLPQNDLALSSVSRQLGIGPRRLQQTLKTEGTSFSQLLESVRRRLALEYLAEPTIPLQELAFLLGYSEPSAFHRAFRRWMGEAPGEYRASQSAKNP